MKKFFYRVQRGETLFDITNRFNLPITVIIKLNGLKEEVQKGDLLYIEEKDAPLYVVKPTDRIDELAKICNKTKDEILEENGLPFLYVGAKIYL
ncbi:MAG: LysM peptidoglycan-binding domain-containing protein [Clostridiales bacterium]|nr:LysM peptidoglycan-binding domain-containing protein [Clostridiales bacterium]